MTLATSIFGTETRLRPLIKAVLVVTALRAAWIAVNIFEPNLPLLGWALVPWPRWTYSWTAWAVELALIFYQLRACIRLGRLLLLRYAPHLAAFLGFSARPASEGEHLRPRNRSWWPTALLLCGILILSCQVLTWLVLMAWYRGWAPFDWYVRSEFAHYPMLVGLALSVLGLMFGGRYIARASGDVSTSFGVVPVADDHWLAVRVHGFADQLKLPRPAVGITSVMNAFAMGARQKSSMVVIGKPLFEFEKDELDAIIGHELGHILHKDIALMQFAEGFQRMLVGVVNILTVFGMFFAASASRKRANARLNAHLAWGTGVVVRKTVFVASELVTKGISRNREFHADAVGAHLTSTDAMAGALRRVHDVTAKPTAQEHHYGYLMFRRAGFGNLFSTHPTLQARLKALDARATPKGATQSAAVDRLVVEPVQGSQRRGFSGLASSDAAPSPLWAKLGTITSRLARSVRRGGSTLRAKVNMRRLLTASAACVFLVLVVPAIINFYALDRRLNDASTSTGQALSSSWAWVIATKEAWFGDAEYTARVKQLGEREQALKVAEARLSADREALAKETAHAQAVSPVVSDPFADALRAQIGQLTTKVAGLVSERDGLRNTILDLRHQLSPQTDQTPVNTNALLLQLDAANADRARLMAQLAGQQDGSAQQAQISLLTDQLAKMTADRDEMRLEDDSLRRVIEDLKTQIAIRDSAQVGLNKRIQDFQNQIAGLGASQPDDQGGYNQPVRGALPGITQGRYGAFAAAGNGAVILTDGSFPTSKAASDAALAECDRFSGGSHCEVKQVFHDTCAAVARVIPANKQSRYELQLGETREDAEEMALSECYQRTGKPCDVTRQVCVR
jgi:Zn-dependent protease with chaperone function